MIHEFLHRWSRERPDAPFLLDDTEILSFREAEIRARCLAGKLRPTIPLGSTVYLYARDSVRLLVALLATQYACARVCVLNRTYTANDLAELAQRLEPGVLITDADRFADWPWTIIELAELFDSSGNILDDPAPRDAGIVVLTTGTTGRPKAVLYKWSRLFAQVRLISSGEQQRWALLYPLNHFAGLQVLIHVIKNGFSIAVPGSRKFPDVRDGLLLHKVDSASATPTFWRMFTGRITSSEARAMALKQITLGGEPITADVLERLTACFPEARITQVYATTELGSCFAVNDGLPGFPANFLDSPVGNVELSIHHGELHVRADNGMESYIDGSSMPQKTGDWVSTGDLVEVRGDRVFFLGRKDEVINVGGVKVFPPIVEEQIRKVGGVHDVRVFGKPNPITGQIVAADIEICEGVSVETVLADVRNACRTTLNRHQQPRHFRSVAGLARSNEKVIRR